MNIKTTLILAATGLALLSAPASARTDGSAGWASAFPYNTGGHVDHPSYSNGYNAYASQNGAPNLANARSHDAIPGWPCIHRSRQAGGLDSAYPSWEECN